MLIMNFSQKYAKFCNLISIPKNSELFPDFESKLIWYLFGITQRQIKLSSQILILFFCIPLSIFLYYGNYPIFDQITSYSLTFLIYYRLNHCFSDKVHNLQLSYNQYYQTLILELNMFLLSTKNSIDKHCIIIEILSKYPNLMINYNESIFKLYNGEKLEFSIQNLVFYSELFQDYISEILNFNFKQDFLGFVIKYNNKFEEKLKINLKSLETNLDIFFFIAFFFPISFNFFSGVWTINPFEIISFIIMYSYLLKNLISNSIFRDFGLIGYFNTKVQNDKEQILFFLYFLKKLAHSLESYSPEYALIKTLADLDVKYKNALNFSKFNYLFNCISLKSIISNFFRLINNPKISLFKPFFEDTFRYNSKCSPFFFKSLVDLMSSHLELENEREIILKSAITKMNVLKIILGLVLGVISPFLFQFGLLLNQFKINILNTTNSVFSISYFTNMVISLIFLGISLIYLNKIDFTNKKRLFSIISILIYFVSFLLTSLFLI